MRRVGRVQWVQTVPAQSFASAAAAISDTTIYVVDGQAFAVDTTPGSALLADGTVVDYDSWTDDSITLSAPLAVAVNDGDPVQVYPAREVKWAGVNFGPDDDWPDVVACTVPHEAKWFTKLADDTYDIGEQPQVQVEMEPEPHLVDMPNQPAIYSASQVPIVIDGPDGESARMDSDGLTFTTDNPVPVWQESSVYGPVAFTKAVNSSGVVFYDADTGEPTGTVIAGSFIDVADDPTQYDGSKYVVIDGSTFDIRKFTSGTESLSGFPIAGTFSRVTHDGSSIYAIDSANDIRKYSASTGVENTSGFPIVGTFNDLAAENGVLVATDASGSNRRARRFDASTGVEVTTDWPITIGSTSDAFWPRIDIGSSELVVVRCVASGDGLLLLTRISLSDGTTIASGQIKRTYGAVAFDVTLFDYDPTNPFLITASPAGLQRHNAVSDHESFKTDSVDGSVTASSATFVELEVDGTAKIDALEVDRIVDDVTIDGDLVVNGSATLGDSTTDTVTIGTYPVTGAWTSFTPTWLGSVTNPTAASHTLVGKYLRIGNLCHIRILITAGSANYGSGNYTIGGLPFDPAMVFQPFVGVFVDASAGSVYPLHPIRNTTQVLSVLLQPTTAGNALRFMTPTVPVTVATGDQIIISGSCEVA